METKHKRIKEEDRENYEYDGIMYLIEGIMLHILDAISISGKWPPRHIGTKTLLAKEELLEYYKEWMKGWQWPIWVSIYAQHNGYQPNMIKKKFNTMRNKSLRYVKKRIKENKIQDEDKITI